jgi:2-polyprenyl-3-methyl-5-hydroxy-6-metoxy-1,4-benzoquinol methylase
MAAGESRVERTEVEQTLGVVELRMRALEHTRKAYGLLPALDRPRILDIGCGPGVPTLELARLSGGEVVGIDIDEHALSRLRRRIEQSGLADRVTVRSCSLFDSGLAAESFDVLWEEGVLHLLDPDRSVAECRRLLKSGGFLVMHETIEWFEKFRATLVGADMMLFARHLLPKHFWWTEYGALLEARIRVLRAGHGDESKSAELTRYADEVATIKADPDRFDCGFYILHKTS